MSVRAVRGAVDVAANTPEAIAEATGRLLLAICEANDITEAAVISAFFTQTTDLDADYPAAAARALGWTDVPLLDAQELEVATGMPRVIRVLLHIESERGRDGIRHVYLGKAAGLRPDLGRRS